MIKTIIFDLGGVIIKLDQGEAIRRFEDLGLSDAKQRLNIYSQTGIFKDLETGFIDTDEFCKQLSALTHRSISFNDAKYAWMGYIQSVAFEQLLFLQELRKKYRLLLLTNTNPFIQNWARSNDFSPVGNPISYYFDKIYCSYELHLYKPDPSFFNRVLELENLLPSEAIFLDDGKTNIDTASALGINVLWVNENCDWIKGLKGILE